MRYLARREFDNAKKYLDLAIEEYTKSEPVQYNELGKAFTALGVAYLETDDAGEAVRQWLLAAESYASGDDPDWPERAKAYSRIASVFSEMDMPDEATKYYLLTEQQYRKAPVQDYRALGGVYYRLSRLAKGYEQIMYALLAQGEYTRSGAQEAGLSAVSGMISAVYANAGVSAEGGKELGRAVGALLDSDKAHPAVLAEALKHLGDGEAGRDSLQDAAAYYLSAIDQYQRPEAENREGDQTGPAQTFEALGNTYFSMSGLLGTKGDVKGERELLKKATGMYAEARERFQSHRMSGRVDALQEKIGNIEAHLEATTDTGD